MTDNDHRDDEYQNEARRQQKHSGPHLKLPSREAIVALKFRALNQIEPNEASLEADPKGAFRQEKESDSKCAGGIRRLHPLTLEPFRLTGLGTPHTPVTLSYHGCLLTPSVDKNHMRPYVEPPPTLRCSCAGELRLKLIEPADRTRQKQREIFVCTNCGREQTLLADRNPYMASHPHQEKRQRTDLL